MCSIHSIVVQCYRTHTGLIILVIYNLCVVYANSSSSSNVIRTKDTKSKGLQLAHINTSHMGSREASE